LLVDIAVATRTSPMDWQVALDADPRLIPTVLAVLDERSQAMEKANKRRR
jgi:hypothetical protein